MSNMTGTRNRVNNYFNVTMGKIVKSLGKNKPEDMTGVTERINAKGVPVYEIQSDFIVGKLVHLEFREPPEEHKEVGASISLTMEHPSGEKAKVEMKWDSAYTRGFMLAFPNLKLSEVFELEPYQYMNTKKGRKVSGLNLFQDGAQLDWAYGTKANPAGMPQLEKVTFKGETQWDNTKQLAFLREKLDEMIATVKDINNVPSASADAFQQSEPTTDQPADDDEKQDGLF